MRIIYINIYIYIYRVILYNFRVWVWILLPCICTTQRPIFNWLEPPYTTWCRLVDISHRGSVPPNWLSLRSQCVLCAFSVRPPCVPSAFSQRSLYVLPNWLSTEWPPDNFGQVQSSGWPSPFRKFVASPWSLYYVCPILSPLWRM